MQRDIVLLDINGLYADEASTFLLQKHGFQPVQYEAPERIPEKTPGRARILIYIKDNTLDALYHRNTIRQLKMNGAMDYCIIVSPDYEIKTAVEFIRLGAVDYIGINEHTLAKLDDTLDKLDHVISLKENIAGLESKLRIRNNTFIASLSLIILLAVIALFIL